MDLSRRPSTDCHEICTQVWCDLKTENLLSKFSPTPKQFGGKTSKFPQFIEDRRQSKAHNSETAQLTDKHITDVSCTINAL